MQSPNWTIVRYGLDVIVHFTLRWAFCISVLVLAFSIHSIRKGNNGEGKTELELSLNPHIILFSVFNCRYYEKTSVKGAQTSVVWLLLTARLLRNLFLLFI